MTGPTGWHWKVNEVTTPKLLPPPRMAQNRIRVGIRRCCAHLTISTNHLGGRQVVDRQPVLPANPSLSTAEREPGYAGVGDDAARRDEPEGLGFVVHVADECSTLDAHGPRLRDDINGIHPGEVEEQAAIDTRESRDRVAAPANREDKSVLAGKIDRADHVCGACTQDNQRRFPRMHRVVRRADHRIPGIVGR